jgi:hypothetical protein
VKKALRVVAVELPRGPFSGWMGLLLRPMLGGSQETALQQLERAAQTR